jgi:hypothetical protein
MNKIRPQKCAHEKKKQLMILELLKTKSYEHEDDTTSSHLLGYIDVNTQYKQSLDSLFQKIL